MNLSHGMSVYPRCDEHGTWDPTLKSGCPVCAESAELWRAELDRVRQRADRLETELCRIVAAFEVSGIPAIGTAHADVVDAIETAAANLRTEGVEPNE